MKNSNVFTFRFACIVLLITLTEGCAMSPIDQSQVPFFEDTHFTFYVLDNQTEVKVQCNSQILGGWATLLTIMPNNIPININGTTVYSVSDKEKLLNCWKHKIGDIYTATLRFKQGDVFLFVFDENGIHCLNDQLAQGVSAKNATLACALKEQGSNNYAKTIEVWTDVNP